MRQIYFNNREAPSLHERVQDSCVFLDKIFSHLPVTKEISVFIWSLWSRFRGRWNVHQDDGRNAGQYSLPKVELKRLLLPLRLAFNPHFPFSPSNPPPRKAIKEKLYNYRTRQVIVRTRITSCFRWAGGGEVIFPAATSTCWRSLSPVYACLYYPPITYIEMICVVGSNETAINGALQHRHWLLLLSHGSTRTFLEIHLFWFSRHYRRLL